MPNPRWTHDRKLAKEQAGVVGVDEAGRGCLAGPVVAGSVIIPTAFFREPRNRLLTAEMNDSKQFDEAKREQLYDQVMVLAEEKKIFTGTGKASVDEASRTSGGLWKPEENSSLELFEEIEGNDKGWTVMVDGRALKKLSYKHVGLVKGDTKSLAIAMASMLAKVTRDRFMRKLHIKFPDFGFDSNKGYGAPVHLNALDTYGPTEHHRPRFLRNILSVDLNSSASMKVEQSQLSFL